jgi:septal ring factor EnvC (AmiA/AmiB activator)
MQVVGRGRGVFLALAAALLAALIVGCGGSSEAAPLKKSQFVKQADEVCASTQKERAEQSDELAESEDSEEDLMRALLEPVENMTDELADLGPPAGQEKEVEAIIAAYEKGISKLEADPGASDVPLAFDQANQLAADYGLTDCVI